MVDVLKVRLAKSMNVLLWLVLEVRLVKLLNNLVCSVFSMMRRIRWPYEILSTGYSILENIHGTFVK